MHTIPDTALFDYIKAIGEIVNPKNFTFASKISNNRVCIYLSSTSIVDKLLKTHDSISVKSTIIPIRRLITPTKRILISNVSPTIPHSIIEKSLENIGLQLVSPVSFLKCGIPDDNYAHIMSF